MKPISSGLLAIAFFFCSALLNASADHEQDEKYSSSLIIKVSSVFWNGNQVMEDSSFRFMLEKGENLFIIYQNDKLACLAEYFVKPGAGKSHLSCRIIVETADGDRYYGKLNRETFLSSSGNGSRESDRYSEAILYNKKTKGTVEVVFKYFLE